jgi:hypothetical protein
MKTILMGCVMLLTVGILSAQSFNVKFTTKTPFVVSGTTLPAGTYQIRVMEDDENMLECTAVSGSPSVMFEADTHDLVPTESAVTFAKYGDKLVLKNVSVAGERGYFVPLSPTEKRSKKAGVVATKVSTVATKQ